MKRIQTVKMAMVLALALGALSVSAAAFAHLPDPGFSVPVPEEWRAGRGDLLRPSIGGTDSNPIIQENQQNTDTVIIEGEMTEDEGIKLFLLN